MQKPTVDCPIAARAYNAYYDGAARLHAADGSAYGGAAAVPGYALGIPAAVGRAQYPPEGSPGHPRCISEGGDCHAHRDGTSRPQQPVAGGHRGHLPSFALYPAHYFDYHAHAAVGGSATRDPARLPPAAAGAASFGGPAAASLPSDGHGYRPAALPYLDCDALIQGTGNPGLEQQPREVPNPLAASAADGPDPLLEQVALIISAASPRPLSGNAVVRHVQAKTDDVVARFLPCVDFLVNCQQELRQALHLAQRGPGGSDSLAPCQFHAAYVAPMPGRFARRNEGRMAPEHLRAACAGLDDLVRDAAAAVASGGCALVKAAFLGGVRENESWGLRRWLSRHGGAGGVCDVLEETVRGLKGLAQDEAATRRLAGALRPIARRARDRLRGDVPAAYQALSRAHPYLPFFHRLESGLRQLATYDPEEGDVICLEDSDSDDGEDAPARAAGGGAAKRPGDHAALQSDGAGAKRPRQSAEGLTQPNLALCGNH